MTQTRDARIRFVVRKVDKVWRVYDKPFACFPYQTPELGKVKQDHKMEAAAQAEADRLGAMAEWPKASALKAEDL